MTRIEYDDPRVGLTTTCSVRRIPGRSGFYVLTVVLEPDTEWAPMERMEVSFTIFEDFPWLLSGLIEAADREAVQ